MPADIYTADTVHIFEKINTNSLLLIFKDLTTNLWECFNIGIRSVDTVGCVSYFASTAPKHPRKAGLVWDLGSVEGGSKPEALHFTLPLK